MKRTRLLIGAAPVKPLHRRKQDRNILLRQIGVFLVQGLSRIKRQRFAAPSMCGIEEWGRYLTGGFENYAQIRIHAFILATRIVLPARCTK